MLFTPETSRIHGGPPGARLAAAARCVWCGATAMRGQTWCFNHKPGPRVYPKGPGRRRTTSHRPVQIRMETGAARLLPAPLLSWPPVRRVLDISPGYRDVVGARHVVLAMLGEAMGDPYAWPSLVDMLRQAGLMLPGDPPRPRLVVPLDLADAGTPRALTAEQGRTCPAGK